MKIITKLLKSVMLLFTVVEAYPMDCFNILFPCCTQPTIDAATGTNEIITVIDENIQDTQRNKKWHESMKRSDELRKTTLANALIDSLQVINYVIESAKDPTNYDLENACDKVECFVEQLNIYFPPNTSDIETRKVLHDIRHALTKMDYAFRNVCEQPSLIKSLTLDLEYLHNLVLLLDSDLIGKEPIHVLELVKLVSSLSRISALQHKVDFKCEVSEGLESAYIYNRLSVKRALSNFLDNAILYTSGCENPSVFFEIKKSNENYVEFTVKDNGVGMSPDVLKKIGELGYRANNSKSSGSGTGLYSSIELIKSMGEEITIKSAGLGLGSTFSFTLPIFYKDKLLEEKEIEKRKFDRASRVLVVEDCEFSSKAITQALLGIFEMPITVVKNGEDAVKAFNNEPYDLILMDTNLETAMTGTYATSEIRKHPINQSEKRPIIISVSGDVSNDEQLALYRIDGCYPKPVSPKHMRDLFDKYFEIG